MKEIIMRDCGRRTSRLIKETKNIVVDFGFSGLKIKFLILDKNVNRFKAFIDVGHILEIKNTCLTKY